MKKLRFFLMLFAFMALAAGALSSCSNQESLVVYVSVDQVIAQPVLDGFEREYKIKVKPVFDVEATKTTGLTNRLIAEAASPKADVFWSGEAAQTEMLKRKKVLEEDYISFGGRARILLVNTDLVPESDYPVSVFDLAGSQYSVAVANPVFGTTATHAAALYFTLGPEQGQKFFSGLRTDQVKIVDGNSVVRDKVASGEVALGLTDTDDAFSAVVENKPVKIIYPDQQEGQIGVFIIPNTVALVKGSKKAENAKLFMTYLTSAKTMESLAEVGWFLPPADQNKLKAMKIDFYELEAILERVKTDMTEMFIR